MEQLSQKRKYTRRITEMAMLAALSVILVLIVQFPIFPATPFLKYDPADITIIMATFLYGPASGIILTAVVSLIQGLTVSADGGIIGIIMHFIATGSYVLAAGLIYKRNKTRKTAVIAMCIGTLTMCLVAMLCNFVAIPLFLKGTVDQVIGILGWLILFNLIKAGANSVIAFFVYKSAGKLIKSK